MAGRGLVAPTLVLALAVADRPAGADAGLQGPSRLPGTAAQAAGDQEFVAVELSTVGFDPVAGVPIVLLREPGSGRVVPIWIGTAEAQAIALALHGVTPPRPMTHDLMARFLDELGAEVEDVLVLELRDNTYFGAVRLRVPGEEALRSIDSRPSDALALALRTGAAIRVAPRVLKEAPRFDFSAPDASGQVVQSLGITVVSALPALRQEFGLPDRAGVVVTYVAGRAAEWIRRGDFIVDVNGRPVAEPMHFFEAVRDAVPGAPVAITYWRGGEERRVELPSDLPPADRRPRSGSLVARHP